MFAPQTHLTLLHRKRTPMSTESASHDRLVADAKRIGYAHAVPSYAPLQAITAATLSHGFRDSPLGIGHSGDFRTFLSTATGFGTVGVKNGFSSK